MYKKSWCTCKIVVLLIKPLLLWSSRCRRCRRILIRSPLLSLESGVYSKEIGSLRNDDSDVNENVKKATGLEAKQQLCTRIITCPSLKKRRSPHTSLPRRCYLTAEGNICAGSSAAEILALDPQRNQRFTRSANFPSTWLANWQWLFQQSNHGPSLQSRSSIPHNIPNSKFEVPSYNNRSCYFMRASWMDKA